MSAAHELLGLTTSSGWRVIENLGKPQGTGANFCVRYLAQHNITEEIGFLKAMDLMDAVSKSLEEMQRTISCYLFEQKITEQCKGNNLSRVVVPLDAGELIHPNHPAPLNRVFYIVFEKAEGNLRERHFGSGSKKWLPMFKALHHVAHGVEQLHSTGITHQDVKPSNILEFKDDLFKISDLGRVVDVKGKSPFANTPFPGDLTYRPTELYFGQYGLETEFRKLCDIYMVGSLAYNMIMGDPINVSIIKKALHIEENLMHFKFHTALPVLLQAFEVVIERYRVYCAELFGDDISNLLTKTIYEMCHPDPTKRGTYGFSGGKKQPSIRRYVGRFSTLVQRANIYQVT